MAFLKSWYFINRPMSRYLIILCFLCLSLSGFSQTDPEPLNVQALTAKLEKANEALAKKLSKINRKLKRKLLKQVPELKDVNIDSLLEERVYRQDHLQKVRSSELTVPGDTMLASTGTLQDAKLIGLETSLNDSTLQKINELRQELTSGMDQTPWALDIHQEMGETLAELGKTEELLKQLQMPDLPELPDLKLPKLPEIPKLEDLLSIKDFDELTSGLGEIGKIVEEYKAQFAGWDQELLARATSLEQVRILQEQKRLMDNYKPLPEGYRQNMQGFQTNDFVKEKLQEKSEEIARVGGKSLEERFQEAQTKMADAKSKFSEMKSLEEGPKKRPNPYAGKPFLKRLVIGGSFQPNRQDPRSLDAALQIAYMINARARIGTGAAYRINLQKPVNNNNLDNNVFRVQGYLDYTFWRTAFVEASYEWNSTDVKSRDGLSLGRQWVQSAMIGAGNRFNLPKGLKGNFTALYNFFHDEKSPYNSPWVFRVGFEF